MDRRLIKMWRIFKKGLIFIATLFIGIMTLSACTLKQPNTQVHVQIDWTDFIKWDGISYERDMNGVIVPPELVGERVGWVVKKVPSEVDTPNYRPEDGMAAFLPVGTEFFEIKNYNSTQYIAVLENEAYILYKTHESDSISFE